MLDLCGTQVKDECIVGLQRFNNLDTLVLRRNNVTDKCIDSLRKIKGLAYIDVTDTLITFEGLKKLRGLPQLQSITIRRKLLKPGEYEQLKKLLHGVKIQDGSREKMVDPELFRPLH